jgi:hypothetical protein
MRHDAETANHTSYGRLVCGSPLDQLASFIEQRIRHGYRRQWPAPLPSRTAKTRHQSQLGVDGLDVAPFFPRCSGIRRTICF